MLNKWKLTNESTSTFDDSFGTQLSLIAMKIYRSVKYCCRRLAGQTMTKHGILAFLLALGTTYVLLRGQWNPAYFDQEHSATTPSSSRIPPLGRISKFGNTNEIKPPIKPLYITGPNETMVFYNRISKCGSTTINNLVETLPNGNEVYTGPKRIWSRHNRNQTDVCRFIKNRLEATLEYGLKHKFITTHTAFLDPRDCGLPLSTLIYMNQFRHPINRFISALFYSQWKRKSTEPFDISWIVHVREKQRRESHHFYAVNQLCGFDDVCTTLTPPVLQRAKSNVESFYPVIGILEDLEISLKLYEHFLPQIFMGAHDFFRKQGSPKVNNNSHPEPTDSELELLASHLKLDIEFYDYLRRRLHRQAFLVGIGGSTI